MQAVPNRDLLRSSMYRNWPIVCAGLMALGPLTAHADFASAMANYQAGKFTEARSEFLELAELGDGASQFNLGAMSLRGEGIAKDQGAGVGWLRASLQNGFNGITEARLAQSEAQLSDDQRRVREDVVARYGSDAMRERVLPRYGAVNCQRVYAAPRTRRMTPPEYPSFERLQGQNGVVIVDFIVGLDGLARDPQVLAAAPPDKFNDAVIRSILRARFAPAQFEGKPIEGRHAIRVKFTLTDGEGVLWNNESIERLKQRADAGQADSQFVVGLLGVLDSSLQIPEQKAQQLILTAAQAGHGDALYWIANDLAREGKCQGDKQKAQLWLQQAARSQLIPPKIALAYDLLERPTPVAPATVKDLLRPVLLGDNSYALKHAVALFTGVRYPQLQDAPLALQAAQKLDELDAQADPQVSEAIAAAYAVNGDFKRAAKFQQRALKTANELQWNTQPMQERLTAYSNNNAWRGDLFAVPRSGSVQ